MSVATGTGAEGPGTRVPWVDVVMSAVAAVSWSLIGMAGTAALGLRLLEADAAGSLGPMTAAVVALGAGGSVTPSGEVSAFGLSGAEADTAVRVAPLGVSLVGALLLAYFFLRSLRAAGVVVSPGELLARAGAVVALFVAMAGGLVWAGHDVVTIDGGSLGPADLPGGGGLPGLGDVGGLLPDRVGDLVGARAAVGFTVDTVPTLLGGLGWSAGVLLVALLASRRTPLPRGWGAVHRVVRPAASAVVTVLLTAVAAGLAAAGYAAVGDDRPRRIAGAALLGAPNGVWLGLPTGLFVPWDGRASGALLDVLPHPVDDLLRVGSEEPVTLGRLAGLDGRVWLLGVAAALTMVLAGVLTAVRTPVAAGRPGVAGFAGRCALRVGAVTAVTLPLLVRLTEVSANASLSVLGFDAFDAGIELRGHPGTALLLGAVWGAGAGAAGALAAWASGAAGTRVARLARGDGEAGEPVRGTNAVEGERAEWDPGRREDGRAGPYAPRAPHRPPDPYTNPYLRVPPGSVRGPEGARPPGPAPPGGARGNLGDVSGAPTVIGPVGPPGRRPRRGPGARGEDGPADGGRPTLWPDDGPPPPPPPPPAPRRPDGGR
ncbi:membrane protein [Streptomyces toyocaensis]|uniref:Membrane protein n=1 Tax=Streptomyces toyocaensis TaxID=55952 RepID=A0A081XLL7_STRTO|nr:streptophobe family protein [Streptomyces toyocaensis]KES04440.1 membrane protein [Streptomyces toyocaensis]